MKKLALFALAGCLSLNLQAQVRDVLMKKAQQTINNKSQSKTSADTTRATQPENNNGGNPSTDNSGQNGNTAPFGFSGGSKKDVQAEYTFNDNVLIELQNYKKDGKADGDPAQVRYHFSSSNTYFGMEMDSKNKKGEVESHTFSVAEYEKSQIVMLMENDGQKQGMVMKYDLKKQVQEAADTSKSDWKMSKTGRTKVILGYTCEEWVAVNEKEGSKNEMWVTKDILLDVTGASSMFAGASRGKSPSSNFTQGPQGFAMEMIMTEKDGKKTTWKALEVNLKKTTSVKTGEYTFLGF